MDWFIAILSLFCFVIYIGVPVILLFMLPKVMIELYTWICHAWNCFKIRKEMRRRR